MGWLLELLLEGIRELCSQFIVDMMEIVTDMFTELLSCDLTLFEELFGVVGDLYKNVMVPMGIAILLLICVWQLFKSMFGKAGLASEDPIELVCRSGMCLFLIVAAKPFVNYILNIAGTPYQWVTGTEIKVKSFSEYVSVLEGVTGTLGIDSLNISLLMLIMQFVVAWNYFKMLFVIAERYVLLGVFSYTSPLAFSTGGSKATNNILASWVKMFGGQIVLIILNSWCLKMFLSGYGNLMSSGYGFTKFFVATLCLVGFCKITFKLDSYMSSLGVNLGRPSNGLGAMGLIMAAGKLFSHVGKGNGSTSSDGGNSGMSGSSPDGQPYGNAAGMAQGAGGPIPMEMGAAANADAFGSAADDDGILDTETPQEDFDGAYSDASVLEELGVMPTGDTENDTADAGMNMDAGDVTGYGRESAGYVGEPAEGAADNFQPDAADAEMTNTDVVVGNDSGPIGNMGDYPVEEDDFDGGGTDTPEMDLEGGSIAGNDPDELETSGTGSSFGTDGNDSTLPDNSVSVASGEPVTGPTKTYGDSVGGQSADTPHNFAKDGRNTDTGKMPDIGVYHDFDDAGKGGMPNMDAGNIPSSERFEKEFRSINREEKIREVPKTRQDIKKRKERQNNEDGNLN